jgi:hypothetical protein
MGGHPILNLRVNVRSDAAINPKQFVDRAEHATVLADHRALNGTDKYLEQHPKEAEALRKDPNLVNDPAYMAQHPNLQSYLARHPDVKQEWQAHPGAFARAAEGNNKYNWGKSHQPRPQAHPTHKK